MKRANPNILFQQPILKGRRAFICLANIQPSSIHQKFDDGVLGIKINLTQKLFSNVEFNFCLPLSNAALHTLFSKACCCVHEGKKLSSFSLSISRLSALKYDRVQIAQIIKTQINRSHISSRNDYKGDIK